MLIEFPAAAAVPLPFETTVTAVEPTAGPLGGWHVTYACGHTVEWIVTRLRIGEPMTCGQCVNEFVEARRAGRR